MPDLQLSAGEALYYEYAAPGSEGKTFVFINALTGSTDMWSGAICQSLQDAGFGTLCFNFRGQAGTRFDDKTDLTPDLIVSDLASLMARIDPPNPILVGLSIGGLFGAQAYLASARVSAGVNARVSACGMVLINTLRKPGRRLDWINQAMVRLARVGGTRLVMMANMPNIATPALLDKMWDASFGDAPFETPPQTDGLLRLMIGSLQTNWDLPYEKLDLPVLILTGKYDRVFRVDADISDLKARIPAPQEIIYHEAGHLIPLESPTRFTEDLLRFAANCSDQPPT